MPVLKVLDEYESMLRNIEAERYSSSGETLAEVIRRVERERPESPMQALRRREREQRTARNIEAARAAERHLEIAREVLERKQQKAAS